MIETKVISDLTAMEQSVFNPMTEMGHEQVVFCNDKETGLKAIIAIHNTVLGPALGGTRMWNYQSEEEALRDVLRLSRGMTYKASITGLNLGGGKAVIIGDSKTQKSEALFRRFGKFINSLGGKYITAEDVGTSTKDMEWVSMETKHVTGIPRSRGGGGDPSPVTAYGVYKGMKAAAKHVYGTDSLEGKTILVQGVGHVGENLVNYISKENAKVLITDINEKQLKYVSKEYGATVVDENIFDLEIDIYAPCALGATLNDKSIDALNCKIVAGAANNQLANEELHGQALMDKGIIYAPDFVINAGGLINVYSELIGYNRELAMSQTDKIYDFTLEILNLASKENIPSHLAANRMAEKRVQEIGKVKLGM